jgi:hypothetical protein
MGTPFGQAPGAPAATSAQVEKFSSGVTSAQADFNKSLADAKKTLAMGKKEGNQFVIDSAKNLINTLNTVVKPALETLSIAENPFATYTGGNVNDINKALGGGAAGSGPSGIVLGSGGKGAYTLDQIRSYMDANNGNFPPDLNTIASGITAADLGNLQNQYNAGKGLGAGTGATSTLGTTSGSTKAMDSIAAISALLSSYGLGDLSGPITEAVQKGYTSDTIQLIMQDPNSKDPLALAFQTRFPANKTRLAAGKSVLSAAEYLAAERTYTQVLQSYGASSLATRDRMNSFISNDISAAEVSDRVGLAVDRVKNADPFTKAALAEYYPMLTQGDIVAAVLDPAEGLPALKRKVQISEIGGAASVQGLKTGLGSMSETSKQFENVTTGALGAEALASFGITQEEARKGYQTVASIAPRSEFLSSISTGEDYTRLQAEQEAFLGLASAKRARESLTAQEEGRFKGQSGLTKTTLTNKGAGQF